MTVRADVQWIDLARGQEDGWHAWWRRRTRLLVGEGDLDSLRGVVQSRDLLADLLQGGRCSWRATCASRSTVLSSASALQALELIRQHPVPLAVAVDEYGSVEGLVTANDLLAAIADLVDTQDERYGVVAQGEDQWEADGALTLDDLQRLAGVSLPRSADYMTISGLVLGSWVGCRTSAMWWRWRVCASPCWRWRSAASPACGCSASTEWPDPPVDVEPSPCSAAC